METFVEWQRGFAPILATIVAALDQCDATAERRWAPALVANADQLRAASGTCRRWSTDHPSPDPDFDVQLARLARSYANAATTLESVATGSSSTWLVVDRELKGLHAMMAKVLAPRWASSRDARPGTSV